VRAAYAVWVASSMTALLLARAYSRYAWRTAALRDLLRPPPRDVVEVSDAFRLLDLLAGERSRDSSFVRMLGTPASPIERVPGQRSPAGSGAKGRLEELQ
jgi:hypothetical protein